MPTIEAITAIINCRSHAATEATISEVTAGLEGLPVTSVLYLFNGHTPQETEAAIRQEVHRAATREGKTALLVAGGDGSVQKVRQMSHEEGDGDGHIIFAHVACGLVNGNIETYGILPKAPLIREAFTKEHIIAVDQMVTRIKTADGNTLAPLYALLAVGINDAQVLYGVEEARGKGLQAKLLSGLASIQHMAPRHMMILCDTGESYEHATFFSDTIGGNTFVHLDVAYGTLHDGIMTTLAVPAEQISEGMGRTMLGVALLVMGIRRANPLVVSMPGNAFHFHVTPEAPLHVDAELQGDVTEVDISCEHQAVLFLAPH